MKLQLNEQTLNAYINEAIEQEINEGAWDKLAKFAGKKVAKQAARAAKKAAPVVQKSGDAFKNLGKSKGAFGFAHNSKRTGAARRALKGANSKRGAEFVTSNASKTMGGQKLEYVVKTMKDDKTGKKALVFLDKNGNKLTGDQLKLAKNNFKLRSQQYGDIRKMGNLNRGITFTAIAGGAGVAAALKSKNPDAPWNDAPEGDGGQTPGDGGFDGTFPWDTTEPAWTPRNPKPSTPAPTAPVQGEPEPTQPETETPLGKNNERPETPERPKSEPLPAINTPSNLTPGATTSAGDGVKASEPQLTLPQNALRTMVNTAQASPTVASQREKNRALRQMRDNAVNAINSDSYGADKATKKADARYVKDAYKTIKRGDQHPSL